MGRGTSAPQLAGADMPGGGACGDSEPTLGEGSFCVGRQSLGEPFLCRGPDEEGSLAWVWTPTQGEESGSPEWTGRARAGRQQQRQGGVWAGESVSC